MEGNMEESGRGLFLISRLCPEEQQRNENQITGLLT